MNDKIIGIIGGMGPEATADFFMKLVKKTKVKKDQEHFRVIIDSNAKIPDRTKAILHKGESPLNALCATAQNLEGAGVDVACITCMTSHYFIEEVQKAVSYPILNAFVTMRNYIINMYPNVNKIGILATSGTIQTGLFQKYFEEMEVIYPNKATQENKVMEAIYGNHGIKSGNLEGKPLDLLLEAEKELTLKGAQLIISGCTEIGLVLKQNHVSIPLIDPMEIMIMTLIEDEELYRQKFIG